MNFLSASNLPDRMVSGIIADCRISEKSLQTLVDMGIEVILSCKLPVLYDAVCAHPDMMIHHLGGSRFLAAPQAYEYFCKKLPEACIIKGSVPLADKYPNDICYNAAVVGECLFCNAAYTAPEILSEYKKIVNVRQGYSKCSICVISENALITSDAGICKAAAENNIDALKIRAGYIHLPGMDYGFIGGATGMISKDTLAVNGDIATHPDWREIYGFCKRRGVDIAPLKSVAIEDIGSIIPIY
ncbi:MAG: hypothetical protein LIO59_06100 [Oscillospiraceae bacterium]|nr:hypothetical protein [Oscillospiraceae bacterium]